MTRPSLRGKEVLQFLDLWEGEGEEGGKERIKPSSASVEDPHCSSLAKKTSFSPHPPLRTHHEVVPKDVSGKDLPEALGGGVVHCPQQIAPR